MKNFSKKKKKEGCGYLRLWLRRWDVRVGVHKGDCCAIKWGRYRIRGNEFSRVVAPATRKRCLFWLKLLLNLEAIAVYAAGMICWKWIQGKYRHVMENILLKAAGLRFLWPRRAPANFDQHDLHKSREKFGENGGNPRDRSVYGRCGRNVGGNIWWKTTFFACFCWALSKCCSSWLKVRFTQWQKSEKGLRKYWSVVLSTGRITVVVFWFLCKGAAKAEKKINVTAHVSCCYHYFISPISHSSKWALILLPLKDFNVIRAKNHTSWNKTSFLSKTLHPTKKNIIITFKK